MSPATPIGYGTAGPGPSPSPLPLPVHGGEHERDVGGEEVIHLVAETCLAQEPTASHQVADGHVEVV